MGGEPPLVQDGIPNSSRGRPDPGFPAQVQLPVVVYADGLVVVKVVRCELVRELPVGFPLGIPESALLLVPSV